MKLFSVLFFSLPLAACASTSTTPRMRVAQDLGCATEATGVRKLATDEPRPGLARWEVAGCGRRAIYVCTIPVRDCWREGEIVVGEELKSPS